MSICVIEGLELAEIDVDLYIFVVSGTQSMFTSPVIPTIRNSGREANSNSVSPSLSNCTALPTHSTCKAWSGKANINSMPIMVFFISVVIF